MLLTLTILITYFKSFISIRSQYISNCNYNKQIIQNYTLDSTFGDSDTNCDCLSLEIKENFTINFTKIIICYLKCWKNDPTKFRDFVDIAKIIIRFMDMGIIELDNKDNKGKLILNISRKIVNNETIVEQIGMMLNQTNITDLFLEILYHPEDLKNTNKTYNFLYRLANIDGFSELFLNIYNSTKTDFLDLVLEFLTNLYPEEFATALKLIREKLGEHIHDLIILFFKSFRDYKDKDKIIDDIVDYIIEYNDICDEIKEVMMDDKIINLLALLIDVTDPIFVNIKRIVISNKEFLNTILDVLKNKTSLLLLRDILKNINDINYIKENIGKLVSSVVEANSDMVDPITELFMDIMLNSSNSNDELVFISSSSLQKFLKDFFTDLNYTDFNFSEDCLELLYYTYFNSSASDKSLFYLYLKKYIFDSSRNKGNFLPFDNCIDNNYKTPDSRKYNITPAFMIGIFNEMEKENNKNSSLYFKFNFLRGYCVPFGYKNATERKDNHPMCSDKDYAKLFLVLNRFFTKNNNSNLAAFSINASNMTPKGLEIFFGILGILFLGFPLLIYIFLVISGNIISKKQKIINEKKKNLKTKANGLIEVNSIVNRKKIIFPRWYQYLNECFNIKNNIKELFNFSFNNTN